MEPSSAGHFDVDAVARPLSERGIVAPGPEPAAPARGPAERIEQSKRRLARDLVKARAMLGDVRSAARRTARSFGVVAAVALLAAGLVTLVLRVRRRPWYRAW